MSTSAVQSELDALAVRLGRSLTIDGLDGELIAYSTQRDDVDPARISTILHRHVAPEILHWQQQHVHADTSEPVTIPANPALGMSARLCVPLRRGDRTLGFLWMVHSQNDLIDDDRDALRHGVDALVERLNASRGRPDAHRPGNRTDLLVRRLFDDDRPDARHRLAVAVPAVVDGTVRVVAVVATGPAGVRQFDGAEFSSLSGSLTAILRGSPGYVGSSVSATHALIVLHHRTDHDDPASALDAIDKAVTMALPSGALSTLGVSDAVELDAHTPRQARHQALTAAELAALDPAFGRITAWSTLGAYRMLLDTSRPTDDTLRPLDNAGGSAPMLLETLEIFLDLGGDIRAVAARLNLHRSSLYYRLDRIAHLLGADLSNGLTRLELHIALKDRRLRNRTLT